MTGEGNATTGYQTEWLRYCGSLVSIAPAMLPLWWATVFLREAAELRERPIEGGAKSSGADASAAAAAGNVVSFASWRAGRGAPAGYKRSIVGDHR